MIHVSVVVVEDAVLPTLSGTYALLFSANQLVISKGNQAPFQLELVSVQYKKVQLNFPVQFSCTKTINENFHTDLIIVPPIAFFLTTVDAILKKNNNLVNWLKIQKNKGVSIASVCTGSYFLAEAGLLNGKEATSHWMSVDDMKRRYPEVKIKADKIITDQDGIYTGGGSYSSLNAVLYLIEKYCGKSIAIDISKDFSIDFGRDNQNIFAVFNGQRQHKDPEILSAQDYIEQNFRNNISVENIATHVNMSKRNFIRRFKIATNNNPSEYLQRIKVEAAKKALEAGDNNITSITYDMGYNDLKSFWSVFKKSTGLSPQSYMKKYNRTTKYN